MRFNLEKLKAVQVDFDEYPFGSDNTEDGLYRRLSGRKYYVGARDWVHRSNARFAFLTTEALMAEVVSAVFRKDVGKPLFRIDADNIPSIYPIQVPVVFDHRANKKGIRSLAKEILEGKPRSRDYRRHGRKDGSGHNVSGCKRSKRSEGKGYLDNSDLPER